MEGESCCLLCLELKQEFVDAILINSVECNSLNIKLLIEKHFWSMKHINTTSWLCRNCWTELYDFHNFYMRIEKAHESFELLAKDRNKKAVDLKEPMDTDSQADKIIQKNDLLIKSHNIEFLDCPSVAVNDNKANTERNPLMDNTICDFTLKQGRLLCLPRKAKFNKRNRTKTALSIAQHRKRLSHDSKQLRDSANKNKSNVVKNKPMPKIESIFIKSEGEIENLSSLQEPTVLSELGKGQLPLVNDGNFRNESDTELLLSVEVKSNVKSNSRTKALRNEQDKFLAKNFKIACFLCDIPFETFCNVLKHFEEQHKEPGYIKCCDKKFYRRNMLIDHVNYHLNPNYFKCNQCDKVLEDRRRLELHCKSHEANNGKNFCCNICGKGFIKIAFLNSHKKIHLSEEEKRFACSECGKNYASNYMLTNHCRATHLKKYHKICEICGKSIQDKTIFERHMLQHEGKNAPSASCDICGLLLTDDKALERHKKVIHPENGQKTYTCSICSKTSPNLRTHKLHVRFTHESGYNYKCTICDKAFKRPQSLKEHKASHTGEILYTCPWCPKTFNSNANMHSHRKKVHPKEWEDCSRKRYSGKLPPRFKPPTKIENTEPTKP